MKNTYSPSLNRYLVGKGGLIDVGAKKGNLGHILVTYQEHIEKYIESGKKITTLQSKSPVIHFGVLDNPNFNAVAVIDEDDNYFIGINIGAVIIIYDLFYRTLSYSNLLPNIGNSKTEILTEPTMRTYYLDAIQMITCADPNYEDLKLLLPKDVTREYYAAHLTSIAIDFLIAHEITHVLNGHLSLIKSKFSHSHYEETNISLSNEETLLRQVLEMDADTLAASKTLSNLLKRYSEQPSISEPTSQFYQNANDLLSSYAFSILSVLRIMAESPLYNNTPIGSLNHPFPRVRSHIILINLSDYVKEYYPEIFANFPEDRFTSIFLEVEKAHRTITGKTIDKEKIIKEIEAGKQQADELLKRWKEIRPALSKHSYVELVE